MLWNNNLKLRIMTTSYLCCSCLSPPYRREFRECSMMALSCGAVTLSASVVTPSSAWRPGRVLIYRAGRVQAAVGSSLLRTLHHHHTHHAGPPGLSAAASRSFLTHLVSQRAESCSALRRTTLNMRQIWWFRNFRKVIILRSNGCCKQWWIKAISC